MCVLLMRYLVEVALVQVGNTNLSSLGSEYLYFLSQ